MKTISKQLQDLFTADQKDRSDGALWEDANFRNEVSKRDKVRKEEVSKYIKNDQLQTAEDYYFSALYCTALHILLYTHNQSEKHQIFLTL